LLYRFGSAQISLGDMPQLNLRLTVRWGEIALFHGNVLDEPTPFD
jgi:hypothetical protein